MRWTFLCMCVLFLFMNIWDVLFHNLHSNFWIHIMIKIKSRWDILEDKNSKTNQCSPPRIYRVPFLVMVVVAACRAGQMSSVLFGLLSKFHFCEPNLPMILQHSLGRNKFPKKSAFTKESSLVWVFILTRVWISTLMLLMFVLELYMGVQCI